jgi:hypothetical protein
MMSATNNQEGAWSSIDSAPRDGTQILCFTSNRDYEISHWHRLVQCWVSKRGFFVEASHWMPLPEAPVEQNSSAGALAK